MLLDSFCLSGLVVSKLPLFMDSYLYYLSEGWGDTMYARLVRFAFGPGKQDKAKKLASDLVPQISSRPGCKGATCFGDSESGEYGLFVLWNSKEEADAASAVIGPKLQQHLAGNVQSPPAINLYEVIESSP